MSDATILLVEDDREMRLLLEDELRAAGYAVVSAASAGEALERLSHHPVDIVVTDLVMSGMKGDELLVRVRAGYPGIPVVIMTAFGSIESAVEAMRLGAYHYVTKPFHMDVLLGTVRAALDERRLRHAVQDGAADPPVVIEAFVAESVPMKRLLARLSRAAAADSPVLIRGESGTGKERVARALHGGSPRHQGPFVPVNCSAIPETLLESLLFGHRRGAFTDAREDRAGLFQQADGGTLFLDEIGDMAPSLQAKLLRVLQEGEVHPLGGAAPVRVDVRVVSATHRDLERMCATGGFRSDLYYRLNVIPLVIPPLRERPEDLVPLVTHLLATHGARLGRTGVTVSREAMESLRTRSWPGNVRELENAIERALVLGEGDVLRPEDFTDPGLPPPAAAEESEIRSLSVVEREQIVRALRAVKGNKAAAARLLGLDRKTLYRKIELYELKPE